MLHDLTHPIHPGMTTYPGDPAVRVELWPDAAPWQVRAVCLGSHTGTHIDAPRHVDSSGRTLSDYPSDRFVGRGIVVDADGAGENSPLAADILAGRRGEIRQGDMVLIRTGWDRHWSTERYLRHPFLSAELAAALKALHVGLLGIDALSVDSTVDIGAIAHRTLLGADILIVENLRSLGSLESAATHEFIFAPLALDQSDGAPVRAFARSSDESKALSRY